jgi:dolichol-phosphate mannosyltransferase
MAQTRWYDIHGIVTVASEAELPELSAFRIDGPIEQPCIRVRIGRRGPHANGRSAASGADASRRTHYDDGLGQVGFSIDIRHGDSIDIHASSLLRHSPHVLYTNVVEPVLRWAFADKGFALVHGACLAYGNDALLVTAQTDTGKTTTVLRVLDREYNAQFISDDLTLVSPDGYVLPYPKPLTISKHTLVAVKTPLLTKRERATLPFQSRLHSRSGRRFGLLLTKSGLPMATINAIVQLLVPPPKYAVQRLVPHVRVAASAKLAGMIVIERGPDGEYPLSHEAALDVLMRNSDDSFGFPPYADIKDYLCTATGRDLRPIERATVETALSGVTATLMRSQTRDWWKQVPAFISSAVAAASAHRPPAPAGVAAALLPAHLAMTTLDPVAAAID